MTRKLSSITIAAFALVASACAQTQSAARTTAYVPAGQAAQPWSWNRPQQAVAMSAQHSPGGRDAQPWSGPTTKPDGHSTWQYAAGIPAGQAAQPGGWMRSVQ
jgi:hypothetical protein